MLKIQQNRTEEGRKQAGAKKSETQSLYYNIYIYIILLYYRQSNKTCYCKHAIPILQQATVAVPFYSMLPKVKLSVWP